MKVLACIPARLGSTRFPEKVLANETGKFLFQHTCERAMQAELVDEVIIATDDNKVLAAAESFGARCVMTSAEHQSGTDRIAEAVENVKADIIVNVQADEPEIEPANIDEVARLLIDNREMQMATLAARIENQNQIMDPNIVKVIIDKNGRAIYFSRLPIPYSRDNAGIGAEKDYLRHLGIYAYKKQFLKIITALPQSFLEKSEKLEQLRAVENGYPIQVGIVEQTCEGIDTKEQYSEFVKRFKSCK